MAFFNDVIKSFTGASKLIKGRLFNAGEKGQVINGPILYSWFWTTKLGKPRGVDYLELRKYEKCAWVQMVLNSILKHASTIEWNVTNEDEEDVNDYSESIDEVKNILKNPNRNGDTFWQIFGPFLRDVLTLDAGTIYKAKSNGGKLKELFVHDGSRFLFKIDKYGVIEGYYQYSFLSPSSKPKFFTTQEIIYGQMNRNTENYPYGFSPLQSIQQEVEVMIQSTRYNKEFFKRNAIPDGIVSVPMRGEEMDSFKSGWETQVAGKPHKLLFHNSEASFTPLNNNNRDMEWLQGQEWYFHTVFGAYGLSPQEVGFYDKSSRATGESQERITVRNAIKPYLSMITDKINREIIPEITDAPIKFSFLITDDISEKIQHQQAMDKLDRNVYTINEIRAKEGLDPVDWGDEPPAQNSGGMEEEEFDFIDPDDKKEDREKKNRLAFIKKGRVIAIGPRGGKIIGYDSRGKPIYDGRESALAEKVSLTPAEKSYEKYLTENNINSFDAWLDLEHQKKKSIRFDNKIESTGKEAVMLKNIFRTGFDSNVKTMTREYSPKGQKFAYFLGTLGMQQRYDKTDVKTCVEELRVATNNDTKQINLILKYMGYKQRVTKKGFKNSPAFKSQEEVKNSIELKSHEGITYGVSDAFLKKRTDYNTPEKVDAMVKKNLNLMPKVVREKIIKNNTKIYFVSQGEAKVLSRSVVNNRMAGFYTPHDGAVYILPITEEYNKQTNFDTDYLTEKFNNPDLANKIAAFSSEDTLANTFRHELAHSVAIPDAKMTMGWINAKREAENKYKESGDIAPPSHITNYAKTNYDEDFAETFAFYNKFRAKIDADLKQDNNWFGDSLKGKFIFMRDNVFSRVKE